MSHSPEHKDFDSLEEKPSTLLPALSNNATFDPEAEKRLRRRIDIHILPTVALLYLFCFIDRANIGNARLAGLEDDLEMNKKSYDYNILLSVFCAYRTVLS